MKWKIGVCDGLTYECFMNIILVYKGYNIYVQNFQQMYSQVTSNAARGMKYDDNDFLKISSQRVMNEKYNTKP